MMLIFQCVLQIINVYISKYESGGKTWPIVHNTTIFSLVLAQIIAIGVFGLKRSPVASGFTVPLVIGTLLFNEFCRERFRPIFEGCAATVMDSSLHLSIRLSLIFKLDMYMHAYRFLLRWIGKMREQGGWNRFTVSCCLPIIIPSILLRTPPLEVDDQTILRMGQHPSRGTEARFDAPNSLIRD